jgi:hypothetical protein
LIGALRYDASKIVFRFPTAASTGKSMPTLSSTLQAESGNEILASLRPGTSAYWNRTSRPSTCVCRSSWKPQQTDRLHLFHRMRFCLSRCEWVWPIDGNRTDRPRRYDGPGRSHGTRPLPERDLHAACGRRITVAQLRDAIGQSVTRHQSLLRYGHAFHIQTAQTALTNGRCTVEQRLALAADGA